MLAWFSVWGNFGPGGRSVSFFVCSCVVLCGGGVSPDFWPRWCELSFMPDFGL
ncbi:hypothetical protein ACE6H2_018703 [Prunus campanulata]